MGTGRVLWGACVHVEVIQVPVTSEVVEGAATLAARE
jgi:hypothetical protein